MTNEDNISPEEELEQIEMDLADIKGQIEFAKAKQKETGEYSDPIWFAKASAALRYKQARHQHLLRLVATLNRQKKKAKALEFEQAFIDAAKNVLDCDTFTKIFDLAKQLAGGKL